MTDTEKAALERRIYDRCLVRVGQLEAEKAVLERRIDELCAEVEYNRQTSRSRLERIDQLKDENAKLREQVEYMTPIALYAASEQERDRMRELGVDA